MIHWKKEILEWAIALGVAFVVVFLIRTFLFTMIRVDGESMLETLQDGDRIASTIIDLKLYGPEYGDIVICDYPGYEKPFFLAPDEFLIKRLIGKPGDTVAIANGQTILNGEMLDEPYVEYVKVGEFYGPITLGEDEYFVMGDNRADSLDGRSFGPIERSEIAAIARLRLWPFDQMGMVS